MTGARWRVVDVIRLGVLPAIAAASLLVAWRSGYFELTDRERLAAVVQAADHSGWAAVLFVVSYALAVTLVLPTTVLSMLAGALFGARGGLALAWTGAMIGTMCAHMLARSVGRSAAKHLVARHGSFAGLSSRTGVATLARLRVLPLAPFGVLDYVAALAGVRLGALLVATAIGILPGTAAYAYAGDQLMAGIEDPTAAGHRSLLIAGVVTLAVTSLAVLSWLRSRRS